MLALQSAHLIESALFMGALINHLGIYAFLVKFLLVCLIVPSWMPMKRIIDDVLRFKVITALLLIAYVIITLMMFWVAMNNFLLIS
jgi:hypothetical protein